MTILSRGGVSLLRNARTLIALAAVLACGCAWATDDNQVIFPATGGKSSTAVAPAGGSLNTVTLVIGVALAGAGGWLVWRNRQSRPLGRDVRSLAIDETRPLGNRQYLVVASYEGKKFLLGVCPGSIQMLSALPDESDKDRHA